MCERKDSRSRLRSEANLQRLESSLYDGDICDEIPCGKKISVVIRSTKMLSVYVRSAKQQQQQNKVERRARGCLFPIPAAPKKTCRGSTKMLPEHVLLSRHLRRLHFIPPATGRRSGELPEVETW